MLYYRVSQNSLKQEDTSMELNQVLEARRSIRHYQDQPVDLTLIGQMIEAAILSPSWKNSQTARYHVVSSPEMLKKNQNGLSAGFQSEKLSGRSGSHHLHLCEKPCRLRKRRSAIQ